VSVINPSCAAQYNQRVIINSSCISLAETGCCSAGFILARYLGFCLSLAFFLVVEILLAALVRDDLTLNVLMLLCPVDAIKQWQMVH